MTPTDKVLGQIAAMSTFIENFPMSILDMMHGKTYTSIFDFIVDVLVACGVDVNQIMEYLLREIYGLEANLAMGIDAFYEQIKSGKMEINRQNEFMQTLEYAIKGVFMTLLSSIYGCSAIPILPNKIFDKPDNEGSFGGKINSTVNRLLQDDNGFTRTIIPTGIIDPMGILQISPTSEDGRLFYAIEGNDIYYKKEYTEVITYSAVTKNIEVTETKEIMVDVYESALTYDKQVKVYVGTTQDNSDIYAEDEQKAFLDSEVQQDIIVTIVYSPYGSKSTNVWEGIIPAGLKESNEIWRCSNVDCFGNGQKSIIHSITINNNGNGVDVGNKTWVYLDGVLTKEKLKNWKDNGLDSVSWGQENLSIEEKLVPTPSAITETGLVPVTEDVEIVTLQWEYKPCLYEDIESDSIERVDFVSTIGNITDEDPEYIVHYNGLNPNTLYQTMDMNAFIWYVLHKGMKTPQVELNHMMWDSRISASKNGIERLTNADWNKWYASKDKDNGEFTYFGEKITENTPIYPIIQLAPQGMAENLLDIKLPSQTYLLPKIRLSNGEKNHGFNASIYKFNWDYLNNIQILQPKILLVGLCEYLLGFSLSTIASVNINFTKKLIEAKLSSAIKSIIEADDMEVENCYTEFSNDEVNTMMEEMLLSRYNATTYGGETATVRVHDTQKYISMLDQINANTSVQGNISQINKLVTEVIANPGTEGSIDYGIQVTTDGNLLKKLLWAIVMPILLSIFTPQVLLLIYLNFMLTGVTRLDSFAGNDFGIILNLLMNKIFGLVKSIIIAIKNMIVGLLLKLFYQEIMPLLIKYEMIILLERITYWLTILKAALNCLPRFKFQRSKVIGAIDNVDYADIIVENNQDTPESTATC